jgi:hypothetical protein
MRKKTSLTGGFLGVKILKSPFLDQKDSREVCQRNNGEQHEKRRVVGRVFSQKIDNKNYLDHI